MADLARSMTRGIDIYIYLAIFLKNIRKLIKESNRILYNANCKKLLYATRYTRPIFQQIRNIVATFLLYSAS